METLSEQATAPLPAAAGAPENAADEPTAPTASAGATAPAAPAENGGDQRTASDAASAPPADAAAVPDQRASGPDAETSPRPTEPEAAGKTRRAKKPAKGRRAESGTKSLVVWRDGRLAYADDSVLVLDLDEAASADCDVHDVVDRLAELREVIESPGRNDAVTALTEIIHDKALT
jgi:hypothetical protein